MRAIETCASCRRFPRDAIGSNDPVWCEWREISTGWDDRACVLHSSPAGEHGPRERAARRERVERLKEQQ